MEFLLGFGRLLIYFALMATVALKARSDLQIHDEVHRKVLHLILLGSLIFFTEGFPSWQQAAVAVMAFVVLVYPILILLERYTAFESLLSERKPGEIRQSLIIVFAMFAALIVILWGIRDQRYLVLASVYAWGLGDAAAALVGTHYGRHRITGRFTDGKKSLEGSLAMFVTSWLAVAGILHLFAPLELSPIWLIAASTALVTTLVELVTPNGMDTWTCPVAAALVLVPLIEMGRIAA